MKRTIPVFLFCIFSYAFSFGQWSGVGGGINSPIGWTNPSSCSYINAMQVYNGNLFVGGSFDTAGGKPVQNIAMWDGSTWSAVGSGTNKYIIGLAVYNGNLYACGIFDSAGGKPAKRIAMWNGSTWSAVGNGISGSCPQSMVVYNSNLYVGGHFDSAGGKSTKAIAMWNGTAWSPVGTGINSINSEVRKLLVYNGNLYAGGTFDSAGGKPAKSIAMWNGIIWSSVGSGLQYKDIFTSRATALALATYNDSLYVGGQIDSAGGKPASNLAEWNGTNWSSPFGIISGLVLSLSVYDTALYVGGVFYNAGAMNMTNCIAEWNGSNWSAIGGGFTDHCFWCCDTPTSINTMVSYNSALYVGGCFDSIGGARQNSIVKWAGPLALNEINNSNENISIYPNPSNGKFTIEVKGNKEKGKVDIYNILGEQVYSKLSTFNSPFSININTQPVGIYFYRLTSEKGEFIGSGKLVIQ
jgi:hypothetical protein